MVELWFLAVEHLRLGNWDLIKGYTGDSDADIDPRLTMQIVNEAAIYSNRMRRRNYNTHQGFETLNGPGFLVTDEQVHHLLSKHCFLCFIMLFFVMYKHAVTLAILYFHYYLFYSIIFFFVNMYQIM